MRLLSTILAVFLAVSMVIVPISMPQAAAYEGAHHGASITSAQGDEGSVAHVHDASADCEASAVLLADDCSSHNQAANDPSNDSCCSMSCHPFQVSAAPDLFGRVSISRSVNSAADEQVIGVISTRIDRPPRTV